MTTDTRERTWLESHKTVHDDSLDWVYSSILVYVLPFFRWVLEWMGFQPKPSAPLKVETAVSDTTKAIQTFVDPFQRKFLNTYASDDRGVTTYNSSIQSDFYSLASFSKLLQDETNTIEFNWKTKILFKTTPRGNVVMHYDVYKQGFAYYSDQQHIPYTILNAIAMDYVSMFRCRDFFMDEYVIPSDVPSRLITLQEMEDKKERDKKRESNPPIDRSMLTDAPFAKFKSYKTADPAAAASHEPAKTSAKEKTQNRFLYRGRMHNFSFIQKPSTKKEGFESALLPKQRTTTYAEYKQQLAEESSSSTN